MSETCPKCKLKYERETGFFYGAMYISSIINMIFFVIAIIAYYLFFVEKVDWRIYIWSYVLFIVLITPFLYRLSRSIWLEFFNDYQPNYNSEQ
jgi:phosphoglycerol transferase MdoB-like AlkP superfamily enzyme